MGRKLLGKGGYGCSFYPALTCTDPAKNATKMVGKIFLYPDGAKEELAQTHLVRQIDPTQKFFLYPKDSCTVAFQTYVKEGASSCKVKGASKEMLQLLMPHGGRTLEQFLKKTPLQSIPRIEMLRILQRIFYGIRILGENGIAHQDIKCPNIVLNNRDGLKLIDWGTTITAANRFTDKNNMYGASDYAVSPPEYRIDDVYRATYGNSSSSSSASSPKVNMGQLLLDHERSMIEETSWVPLGRRGSLDGLFNHYLLNDADRVKMMENLYKHFKATDPIFKNVPITAADVYGLGFLMLCVTPWLVPFSKDNKEVASIYGMMVHHMMAPDPRYRMSIKLVIKYLQKAFKAQPEGKELRKYSVLSASPMSKASRSPEEEMMYMEQLFPVKITGPTLPDPVRAQIPPTRTPVIAGPSITGPTDKQALYTKYNRMTMVQLRTLPEYKSITPLFHKKSLLPKDRLVELLVTRESAKPTTNK